MNMTSTATRGTPPVKNDFEKSKNGSRTRATSGFFLSTTYVSFWVSTPNTCGVGCVRWTGTAVGAVPPNRQLFGAHLRIGPINQQRHSAISHAAPCNAAESDALYRRAGVRGQR